MNPTTLKVLDLFSGIGGFSLGLEKAGMKTVAFCEIDPFCRSLLSNYWPDVPIFDDVCELSVNDLQVEIDLICGGFPCQDISTCGKQVGIQGEKSGLWIEFRRLIDEIKPMYVVIENVANLRSDGLVTVLQHLWEIGYDAEWHIIPACSVGAPHKRERVWVIAYPNSIGMERTRTKLKPAGFDKRPWRDWSQSKPGVLRMDDGLPRRVHANRITALGNSIIPQIAYIIGLYLLSNNSGDYNEHKRLF